MTPAELGRSADRDAAPPGDLRPCVAALWWARRGDWERAHALVQTDEHGRDAAWVHAYLHRREGDTVNARYWYRRAGRPVASGPSEAEWADIAAELLSR